MNKLLRQINCKYCIINERDDLWRGFHFGENGMWLRYKQEKWKRVVWFGRFVINIVAGLNIQIRSFGICEAAIVMVVFKLTRPQAVLPHVFLLN